MKQNGIIIGFSEKYFILWNVFSDEHRQVFQYVKNISMDKDVVREKYPDVEIDYTLHGSRRIVVETPKSDDDSFQHGRYIGLSIIDCKDYDYMFWYYGACANSIEKNLIFSVLEPVGYRIISDNGHDTLMTPDDVRKYEEKQRIFNETLNVIKNVGTIEVTITSNPDYGYEGFPYMMSTDNDNIIIVVDEAVERFYKGYMYLLPIINGKVCRVKNKKMNVDCSKYEIVDNRIYVRI